MKPNAIRFLKWKIENACDARMLSHPSLVPSSGVASGTAFPNNGHEWARTWSMPFPFPSRAHGNGIMRCPLKMCVYPTHVSWVWIYMGSVYIGNKLTSLALLDNVALSIIQHLMPTAWWYCLLTYWRTRLNYQADYGQDSRTIVGIMANIMAPSVCKQVE